MPLVPCEMLPAIGWGSHRTEQTGLNLQMFIFFFTTSIQNSTDKSMKVILFTKTSGGGERGQGRHAVLVLGL